MSYTIYQTEALVIGHRNVGEANRIVHFLTKDFGLVRAKAQNVRSVNSKLRYGLQLLDHCTVDLVRGREYWRLTNCAPQNSHQHDLVGQQDLFRVFGKVCRMLGRLLHGEEENQDLYNELLGTLQDLSKLDLDPELHQYLEHILLARALHYLGYWEPGKFDWILEEELSNELLGKVQKTHKSLTLSINEMIAATQL